MAAITVASLTMIGATSGTAREVYMTPAINLAGLNSAAISISVTSLQPGGGGANSPDVEVYAPVSADGINYLYLIGGSTPALTPLRSLASPLLGTGATNALNAVGTYGKQIGPGASVGSGPTLFTSPLPGGWFQLVFLGPVVASPAPSLVVDVSVIAYAG